MDHDETLAYKEEFEFLSKLITHNEDQRISLSNVLNDKFMKEYLLLGTIDKSNVVLNRLINFRLKQLFPKYIGSLINLQETDDIDQIFQIIDNDRSGFIDKDELKEIFTQFVVPEAVDNLIDQIMKTIDIDGNDMIDYNEFVALVQSFDVKKKNILPTIIKKITIEKDLTCNFNDMMASFGIKNKSVVEAALR